MVAAVPSASHSISSATVTCRSPLSRTASTPSIKLIVTDSVPVPDGIADSANDTLGEIKGRPLRPFSIFSKLKGADRRSTLKKPSTRVTSWSVFTVEPSNGLVSCRAIAASANVKASAISMIAFNPSTAKPLGAINGIDVVTSI